MNHAILHAGLGFTVKVEHDHDHGAPWEAEDGHGPVSDWRRGRDKRAGERELHSDRGSYRFYDVVEATRIAKRDNWGLGSDEMQKLEDMLGRKPTRKQIIARAVELDFEWLRRWCTDQWSYVVLTVTLCDTDGDETHEYECLGGLCSDDDECIDDEALNLAKEIAARVGDARYIERGAKRWQVRSEP